MKKIPIILVVLVMLLALGTQALAQTPPPVELEGIVTEVTNGGSLLVDTVSMGPVMVHVNDETTYEGNARPGVGRYIYVLYSGILTRSIPPQATALKISCHLLDGLVVSVDTDLNTLLMDTKEFGQVMVHLPQINVVPKENDFITVYFSGVMAMSYPGQISAMKVDSYQKLAGVVAETGEDYFMLDGEEGLFRVNIGSESRGAQGVEKGARVTVYYAGPMTKSLPPQVFGAVVEVSASGN